MTDIIKKTGFSIGLILGVLLILLSSYIYFENLALLTNVWAGVLAVILTVIFGIISIIVLKSKLGGLISFKEAFSVYFITLLTGTLFSCFYVILLYGFILSEEYKLTIIQAMKEYDIKSMKQNLATPKQINETIEKYKTYNPLTPGLVIKGYLKYLLRDCLIGFLVALIFRNKRTL